MANKENQSKTLVLCFDGTSNQFSKRPTNVVKFCELLDKSDPQRQMVYYQPGIGTYVSVGPFASFGRAPSRFIDLMTACYLSEHVCGGYHFLMETYCPGDKICLLGFSRGAYTARALAAMLHRVGLLPRLNAELVRFAWSLFKRRSSHDSDDMCYHFRHTFSREVDIQFLGLWDSVSSVGLLPEVLPFTATNSSVLFVRHALALDERRIKFRQNHWTNGVAFEDAQATNTNVKQVWFTGTHCDVGGGNANTGSPALSNTALRWMVRECHKTGCGIIFNSSILLEKKIEIPDDSDRIYTETQEAISDIHPSMSWKTPWWFLFELVPMRRKLIGQDGKWKETIRMNLGRGRDIWTTLGPVVVHSSVRIRQEKSDYIPKASLPKEFTWED